LLCLRLQHRHAEYYQPLTHISLWKLTQFNWVTDIICLYVFKRSPSTDEDREYSRNIGFHFTFCYGWSPLENTFRYSLIYASIYPDPHLTRTAIHLSVFILIQATCKTKIDKFHSWAACFWRSDVYNWAHPSSWLPTPIQVSYLEVSSTLQLDLTVKRPLEWVGSIYSH